MEDWENGGRDAHFDDLTPEKKRGRQRRFCSWREADSVKQEEEWGD